MPPHDRKKPRCELSAKVRWNRLARVSLAPELEAIGVFATAGTPVSREDERDNSVNDAYFDESDKKKESKEFDVRISLIKTNGIAELGKTLSLWLQESPSRHVSVRSYDGATYRIQFIADEDMISVLRSARLIDVVERPTEVESITKRINTFLLGM